ncbi:F0F1 ATP synthase subunit epsilon [Frondihabitans australicus]|uniref:ATP synthase F1 subcomplex epsilon subunit n=1 Tax=Frondihabitans australicus TaxID=386892 RepID=A0A495ICS8_9MICO|nr:F0F1 ATP synthase subunit epsilon [Frondihabitans australicus]RKR73807.1 ATP synthase F1 subcomplex epsilon subunit [Frondihabitans australicus]
MPLTVNLVSADQQVWSGEAAQVTARTTEGEIGILPGHQPVLAILASGQVRVRETGGGIVDATAEDGFLSVENDTVTIVARNAALA